MTALAWLVHGLNALLLANLTYQATIGVAGLIPRRRGTGRATPSATPTHRVAVVIPAHNEAVVLGATLRSIAAQDYPRALVEVHVIVDHCTDDTAAVARAHGAVAHVREDAALRGKGHALAWLFPALLDGTPAYHAVCVLDADNLMGPGFLRAMDAQLAQGHAVVQGYLDSKNPDDSWVAGNYALAYWTSNRVFQLARERLGLSCALGGTGFVVTAAVLRAVGWRATSLTEDLEFSMQAVLCGLRVHWAHDAVVYDEKPQTLAASWRQRRRWMQGHADCAGRYLPALLRAAVARRSLTALDAGLYLLQPALLLAGAPVLALRLAWPALLAPPGAWGALLAPLAWLGAGVLLLGGLVASWAEGRAAITRRRCGHLLTVPLFSLTWIPVIALGILHRHRRAWAHTAHTRAVELVAVRTGDGR